MKYRQGSDWIRVSSGWYLEWNGLRSLVNIYYHISFCMLIVMNTNLVANFDTGSAKLTARQSSVWCSSGWLRYPGDLSVFMINE